MMVAPVDPVADKAATVARTLFGLLLGLDLKQAEEAVEDARKIAWICHFSGNSWETLEACYARSPQASAVATGLIGHRLLDAEAILQELRSRSM
ncbi:hypothetical protein [Xanthobacter sediminis]|uniref:hypothetical protein n=1 Tax=Xanthobacter sediminis TaxID=3119926 RepID=UPI00372BE5E7